MAGIIKAEPAAQLGSSHGLGETEIYCEAHRLSAIIWEHIKAGGYSSEAQEFRRTYMSFEKETREIILCRFVALRALFPDKNASKLFHEAAEKHTLGFAVMLSPDTTPPGLEQAKHGNEGQ